MWWIIQVLAVLAVTCVHTFNRWSGIHAWGFVSRLIVNIIGESVAAPLFMWSYAIAPSFFQVSFLGTVVIAFFMFLSSMLFFSEALTVIKVIGGVLALAGAIILIL